MGMDNKSSAPSDLRSAPPVQESPQVTAGAACCSVGPAGPSITERSVAGTTGTMGNAKVLNSDDQMPGPSYPNG